MESSLIKLYLLTPAKKHGTIKSGLSSPFSWEIVKAVFVIEHYNESYHDILEDCVWFC